MKRILPCQRCGTAKLKDGQGKLIPYTMSLAPSAFRTPGMPFQYLCMGCMPKPSSARGGAVQLRGSLSLSKMEFYALPDLDPPPEPSPVVEMTPFEIQEGLKIAKAEVKERKAHFARIAASAAAVVKKATKKPKK